jgi:hypothetical protein
VYSIKFTNYVTPGFFFLIKGALHVLSVTASRESPRDCSAPISKVVNLDLPCHLGTRSYMVIIPNTYFRICNLVVSKFMNSTGKIQRL